MRVGRRCFTLTVLLLVQLSLLAQVVNQKAILQRDSIKSWYSQNSNAHTAFKPSFLPGDSTQLNTIKIQPAFDFQGGFENKQEQINSLSSLGFSLEGNSKKWDFGLAYMRSIGRYMTYQNEFIQQNRVLPGSNVSTVSTLIQSDLISSFIHYKANDFFDFEIGYGKNFIGDGYRSLLLSDFANSSPYAKITTQFWKIQYSTLFASHQNIYNVEGENSLYQKKYTATHFLDYKATKWLTIGLFETIVWQAKEEGYTRGFDPNYLNPVIFYRPVEFSVGSSDNALVGANIKITPFKHQTFYAQLIFDEFLLAELRADVNQFRNSEEDIQSGWWANKYGFQLGWQGFELFKIKGLQSRVEFNFVRPYTYAHSSPTQAYSNYNLSLAHPLGANFHEFVSIVNYQKEQWFTNLQFNQSRKGLSSLDENFEDLSTLGENWGGNVQLSNQSRSQEYENKTTQGKAVTTKFIQASIGHVIKKEWNLIASTGFIWREQKSKTQTVVNRQFYFSLKTNLFNQYWDH